MNPVSGAAYLVGGGAAYLVGGGVAYLVGRGALDRRSDVTAGCGWGRSFQEGAAGCAVEGVRVSARSTSPTNHTAGCVAGLHTHTHITTFPTMLHSQH